MSKMKRMMVAPYYFGSRTEYGFEGGPSSLGQFQAHHDLCRKYTPEFSIRVWEPGRNALSMPGYSDYGASTDRGVELPLTATIHGIKGHAVITMGMDEDSYGYWTDESGDPVPLAAQPNKDATKMAVSGIVPPRLRDGGAAGDYWEPGDGYGGVLDMDTYTMFVGQRQQVRIPFFIAMYRGTMKYIDDQSGAEIDSGPGDDPSVLLGLDITNPSVLESSRLDWWDCEYIAPPSAQNVFSDGMFVEPGVGLGPPTNNPTSGYTYTSDTRGGYHKYALNLDANKTLGPDQVLWLHWKTGGVRMPVIAPPQAGSGAPRLTCLTYWGHSFTVSIQASMLVSSRLTI